MFTPIPNIENGDLMHEVRNAKLNPTIDQVNALSIDVPNTINIVMTNAERLNNLETTVVSYLDFFTAIQEQVNEMSEREQDINADLALMLNYMFASFFPRLFAVEKALGITGDENVEMPGADRRHVTWEHDSYMQDTNTVFFQTNDIAFGEIGTLFDFTRSGLVENANILNAGEGYFQLNWGNARTVVRINKNKMPGWNNNASTDLKIAMFSKWFIDNVDWKG